MTIDIQVKEAGPCRKTLTIKVPADRVQAHIAEVYQAASHQVQLKGFRPGKVPRKVLEQRLGPSILAEAKESLINRSFEEAVREHKIPMVGRPELDGVGEEPLDEARELEFKVHLDVRPEFQLQEVKGLPVRRADTTVTDEDVQNALQQLAAGKRTMGRVDEPAADGDFVKVDMTFRDQGGQVLVERKGVQLTGSIPVAGTDAARFAESLRGTTAGAELSLDLTFPANFEKVEVRGQPGTVGLKVHEVLRVSAPPIDDAFAKGFDYEDLASLQAELRKRIGEEKTRQEQMRQEGEILDRLLKDHPYDVPATLVEDQTKHQLAMYQERLKEAKLAEEEIQRKLDEAKDEARQDAERRVRVFFLLDAIARKEKIFVTESDVEAEYRNIAAAQNVDLEQVRAYFDAQTGARADLRVGLLERKVRVYLRENAQISDN